MSATGQPVTTPTPPASPPPLLDSSASHSSASTMVPTTPEMLAAEPDIEVVPVARKKKKKPKKRPANMATASPGDGIKVKHAFPTQEARPVLCISRNKHWKFISSYHGPWLQLPLELLESLLVLNCDPAMLTTGQDGRGPQMPPRLDVQQTSLALPYTNSRAAVALSQSNQTVNGRKAAPPPIDPGVFRSVLTVRRLVEEATDLAVRAASGLSAAALSSISNNFGNGGMHGIGGLFGESQFGKNGGSGRSVAMSPARAHRLRVLAVQRLAQAYKADEIAASVMVMQGASSLDDIAERVLATDPTDLDAQYVHFFHEKIPSRQVAESTTTEVLDSLIATQPQRLEYFRTRGVVHCFHEEYGKAVRDFTHALKETRAARKARTQHSHDGPVKPNGDSNAKRKKGGKHSANKTHGSAPTYGISIATDTEYGGATNSSGPAPSLSPHPSVLADAPEPMEPQILFLRGTAYLANAVSLVEKAVLELEDVRKPPIGDGSDLRLSSITNGRYGGIEQGHPDGPLGSRRGVKARAYIHQIGGDQELHDAVEGLAKKAIRDFERFLAHFDSLPTQQNASSVPPLDEVGSRALVLKGKGRADPDPNATAPSTGLASLTFTTYHPLLVEAHFSSLIALLMIGDFIGAVPVLTRAAALVDGLEGYPVFLPARSMAQAELVEILDRLIAGWDNGRAPLPSLQQTGRDTSTSQLAAARALLQSVAQKPMAEDGANEAKDDKSGDSEGASHSGARRMSLNFPLHGPRVDVVLAWLGAAHLPHLDAEAAAEKERAREKLLAIESAPSTSTQAQSSISL